jgi:hypothetical protein
MTPPTKTITYGNEQVPLLERPWKRRNTMVPYYRIERMKPGQKWHDMTDPCKYSEHYVQLADGPIPVGVMIARELRDEGAIVAMCTDMTLNRLTLLTPDLICVEPIPPLSELLDALRAANEGSLAGLPDAIAIFPDGSVAMREAKVAKKDRLNRPQHAFAPVARRLLGGKLDLAVVEWGYEAAEKT